MIGLDRSHGGNPPDGVLDFSASINPLGPPRAVLEAYHASVVDIASYPPAYPRRLEAALAGWLEVAPEGVLAGNGSTQLIYLLARVLKPRFPVVVTPTFSELANSLIIEGLGPRALHTNGNRDFHLDPEGVLKSLGDGADAIFIGRPNSPTGTMIAIDEAVAIAAACEYHNSWCLFDEAFIDFAQDHRSAIAIARTNRKVIVLRSLTKIFALPGLRVGCVAGHPETIEKLRDAIEPWSVNAVADRVGRACLEVADAFIRETRRFVTVEMARLANELARLPGIRVFPSAANFMMMEIEEEPSPGAFGKRMIEQGIRIRDLRGLPGCRAGLYRIGIRSQADNDRFLKAAGAG